MVFVGSLQTRKDTRRVLRPLYNRPDGIQATDLVTRMRLVSNLGQGLRS